MAQWQELPYKTKQTVINPGGGENHGVPAFHIGDGEYQSSLNMDSREYPAATVRPGRAAYAVPCSSSALSLGAYEDSITPKLHVVDGNTWKYWDSLASTFVQLTTSLSSVGNLKSELISMPSGSTVMHMALGNIGNGFRIYNGTTTIITVSDTNAPLTNYFAYHKGRIYAGRYFTLHFCALNIFTDWTSANDAGSIIVAKGAGSVQAVSEYADKVIVWTKSSMQELYGSGPSNFELVDIETNIGCISHRSVVKSKGSLYWVANDGFYEYNGGSPVKVSQEAKYYFDNMSWGWTPPVCAAMDDYIYIAMEIGEIGKVPAYDGVLLKYDTRLRKWYRENGWFKDLVTMNNEVYGIDNGGAIWKMRDMSKVDDNGTAISWAFVTKQFKDNDISGRQTLSKLDVIASRSTGSTSFSIGYSTNVENNDSTSFTALNASTIAASSNTQNRNIKVSINELTNTPWYKLRFAGTGQATIHAIQKKLRSRR